MRRFKVHVDREECISCGACWESCPDVFEESPDDGLTQIVEKYRAGDLTDGETAKDLATCLTEAEEGCPVEIIHVAEIARVGQRPAGNDRPMEDSCLAVALSRDECSGGKPIIRGTIRIRRVYEPATVDDGQRFLVDRLWPRGVKRDDLSLAGWLKEVAPSDALRRWFGHEPSRWDEFQRRYFAELDGNVEGLRVLQEAAGRGDITLLYGARDAEHNNAVALRTFLLKQRADAPQD